MTRLSPRMQEVLRQCGGRGWYHWSALTSTCYAPDGRIVTNTVRALFSRDLVMPQATDNGVRIVPTPAGRAWLADTTDAPSEAGRV